MIDEPKVLRQLIEELRRDLKVEELLQRVVDGTSALLEVTRVSAWLLDAQRTQLIAGARAGMPLHNKPDFQYRLGHGLIGWIAQRQELIRTGAADEDPRFLPRPGMAEKLGSFLGVPLIASKACIGVLSAVAPEANYFSARHENLMVVVGGIVATRLELARDRR
jgi:signal transduction protein with GAF and PtsI domain